MPPRPISTVFFDVGYTLVDETRLWTLWAEWLGASQVEFFTALDDVIAKREHHRKVFQRFKPGFDIDRALAERDEAGWTPDVLALGDFYPDAVPVLRELKARGYRIGLAGNQPARAERVLGRASLPIDILGSSATWGVSKPSPEFFARLVREAGVPASAIAYVGDRLDNDVLPAVEAEMFGIFIPRGPWGRQHDHWPDRSRASAVVSSLSELAGVLEKAKV